MFGNREENIRSQTILFCLLPFSRTHAWNFALLAQSPMQSWPVVSPASMFTPTPVSHYLLIDAHAILTCVAPVSSPASFTPTPALVHAHACLGRLLLLSPSSTTSPATRMHALPPSGTHTHLPGYLDTQTPRRSAIQVRQQARIQYHTHTRNTSFAEGTQIMQERNSENHQERQGDLEDKVVQETVISRGRLHAYGESERFLAVPRPTI